MSLFARLNQSFAAAIDTFNQLDNLEKQTVATLNFNLANPVEIEEDELPLTVEEALEQYSEELGLDKDRITTVTVNNKKVDMDYEIKVGDAVRFLITSEGKG